VEIMARKETVSIVIPAYNAEQFIGDAIKSCFSQTYRPMEVIVVNDGSKDATVNVVESLSALVPDNNVELRLTNVHENKGAANALNLGFSNAKGDYICWLSADDMYVDKDKTQYQLEFMSKKGVHWSYFRDAYVGAAVAGATLFRPSYLSKLRILDPLFSGDSELRLMMLLFRNPVSGSSTMFKRACTEMYGQFDPVTRNVDGDGDLWMRYSALRLRLAALRGSPVFYRRHAMQTSRRKTQMLLGCELTRARMLRVLDRTGDLLRLVKKFVPFFPVVWGFKLHFERPFTSEFLFNYILDHKKAFNRIFVHAVRKSLNDVRNHTNYRLLDKSEFDKQLSAYMKSCTFKKFEGIFSKR